MGLLVLALIILVTGQCQGREVTNVTLVGGSNDGTGRVVLTLRDGKRGTVCMTPGGPRNSTASAICRMLGASGPAIAVKADGLYQRNGLYGQYVGRTLISDVNCTGNESAIEDCSHSGWGLANRSCTHADDLGVICTFKVLLDCNFDDKRCLLEMTSRLTDGATIQWLEHRGQTQSVGTGPSYDHTKGKQRLAENLGFYLYIEASFKREGEFALLVTKAFSPRKRRCLSFYYHANGVTIGSLQVKVKSSSKEVVIFKTYGHKGDKWIHVQVDVEEEGQLIFNGTIGETYESDLALDDIMYSEGSCELIARHPEEQIKSISLVGGPKTNMGRVVITLLGRRTGTVCIGNERSLNRTATVICRMLGASGPAVGLRAHEAYGTSTEKSIVSDLDCSGTERTVEHCLHNEWNHPYPHCNGTDDLGVICNFKTLLDCNFDDKPCTSELTNSKTGEARFIWRRHRGPTATPTSGLSFDHTKGKQTSHANLGHYMYVQASGRDRGEIALLASKPFNPSMKRCLSFYYYAYGTNYGYIQLQVKVKNSTGETVIFTTYGNPDKAWIPVKLDVTQSGRLFFKGTIGYSDVAIDDVKYVEGSCNLPLLDCNFDDKPCHAELTTMRSEGVVFRWTKKKGLTYGTGPAYDHTKGPHSDIYAQGYYMYIDTTYRKIGDTARLVSKYFLPNRKRCLSFYYHSNGAGIDALYVKVKNDTEESVVFKTAGQRANVLIPVRLEILYGGQLILEGVKEMSGTADLAIDDVKYADGACGPPRLPIRVVRLVDKPLDSMGHVEVTLPDNRTGGVCAPHGYSDRLARIICRKLGYGGRPKGAYGLFGYNNEAPLIGGLYCSGNESSLAECPWMGWDGSERKCNGSYSLDVICSADNQGLVKAVGLANGTYPWEGRVVVTLQGGRTGSLCVSRNYYYYPEYQYYLHNVANVVCRMLGINGTALGRVAYGQYGSLSGALMTDVYCNGTESSLNDCSHAEWGGSDKNCLNTRSLGVTCYAYEFCPQPESGLNTDTTVYDVTYQAMAVYTCTRGYDLVSGSLIRTCQQDKTWSGTAPVCINFCPHPESGVNAKKYVPSFSYKANLAYKCDPGYELYSGDLLRTCQKNRSWNGSAPVCLTKCMDPESGLNCNKSVVSLFYRAVVTYSCRDGFVLKHGDLQRTCQADKTWNGTAPVCAFACTLPEPGVNAELLVTSLHHKGTVIYWCHQGYKLKSGDLRRTCLSDRRWSGFAPVCVSTCPEPHPGVQAQKTVFSVMTGGTVVYTCNPGYHHRSGDLRRTCHADRTWSGQAPLCVVKCASPDDVINAKLISSLDHGSAAFYTCKAGYQLVSGNLHRTCQPNATWSGRPPTCGPMSSATSIVLGSLFGIAIVIILVLLAICLCRGRIQRSKEGTQSHQWQGLSNLAQNHHLPPPPCSGSTVQPASGRPCCPHNVTRPTAPLPRVPENHYSSFPLHHALQNRPLVSLPPPGGCSGAVYNTCGANYAGESDNHYDNIPARRQDYRQPSKGVDSNRTCNGMVRDNTTYLGNGDQDCTVEPRYSGHPPDIVTHPNNPGSSVVKPTTPDPSQDFAVLETQNDFSRSISRMPLVTEISYDNDTSALGINMTTLGHNPAPDKHIKGHPDSEV